MRKHIGLATPVMLAVILGLLLTAGADAAVVTLQPGPAEGKDALVYSSTDAGGAYAGYNYGAADYLHIRGDYYNSRRAHFFVEFDVSGLTEEVATAKFSALSYMYYQYGSSSTTREIAIYEVTEDWTEGVGTGGPALPGEITCNTQPSFDPTPVATLTVKSTITQAEEAAGGIWHVWDSEDDGNAGFADLVEQWRTNPTTNHGMMIRLVDHLSTSGRPYHKYHSSDYMDDPLLRPILEVSDTGGTPDPIPGDANLDNVVNDQDASLLASNWQYGPDATWGQGDFDGNNIVNDADASILAAHWQDSQEGAAPVPEPGTLVLLAGALLSLLVWRRR